MEWIGFSDTFVGYILTEYNKNNAWDRYTYRYIQNNWKGLFYETTFSKMQCVIFHIVIHFGLYIQYNKRKEALRRKFFVNYYYYRKGKHLHLLIRLHI